NYNELLGILAPIEIKNLKEEGVNRKLAELNKKVERFLKIYDNDGNREIDIEELVRKREELSDDLSEKVLQKNNPLLTPDPSDASILTLNIEVAISGEDIQKNQIKQQIKELFTQNQIKPEELEPKKKITISKIQSIINSIKELEKAIINHRENNQQESQANIKRTVEDDNQANNNRGDNGTSHVTKEEGEITPSASSFRFTNLTKRRKSATYSKENETYKLQNHEQDNQNIATSSSSEYNYVIQMSPK
ncbi:11984_t:CDS:2, partial [Diversispora eburnea]